MSIKRSLCARLTLPLLKARLNCGRTCVTGHALSSLLRSLFRDAWPRDQPGGKFCRSGMIPRNEETSLVLFMAETRQTSLLARRSSLLSAFESRRFAAFPPRFREIAGSLRCHCTNLFPTFRKFIRRRSPPSSSSSTLSSSSSWVSSRTLSRSRPAGKSSSSSSGITRFSGTTRPKAARNNFFVCRKEDPLARWTDGPGIARCSRQMKFSKLAGLVCACPLFTFAVVSAELRQLEPRICALLILIAPTDEYYYRYLPSFLPFAQDRSRPSRIITLYPNCLVAESYLGSACRASSRRFVPITNSSTIRVFKREEEKVEEKE